jgi:hypothetical protein
MVLLPVATGGLASCSSRRSSASISLIWYSPALSGAGALVST